MRMYNDFHVNDAELHGEVDYNDYCKNRTSKEEAMLPFLSFPILKSCNFSCVYCGEAGEATASKSDRMTLEKMKELVTIAQTLNFKKYRITGGEPFLHKDIDDMLLFFNNLGCYILVNTNGSLLLDHKEILQELNPDIFKFAISLDTLNPERFLKIARPKNPIITLDSVLASAEYLAELGLLLRINMVVGKHNYDDVYNMIEFCKKYKCRLKLLDIVSVPVPFGKRQDYFIDLSDLENEFRHKCDLTISHSYSKSFGIPCIQYKFGETHVTVKNGTKGSHYDRDGVCSNCTYYPCHEGVYDIFAYSDGRVCSCRWRDEQTYDDTKQQLIYLIESFRRASFIYEANKMRDDMPVRRELKDDIK